MNKYDLNHVTHRAIRACRARNGTRAYQMAWETYYTIEHIETVLRRAAATRRQREQRAVPDHLVQGLHRASRTSIRSKAASCA